MGELLFRLLRIERAETTPPENTKEPTPKSMRDVPQFSTLAKRRGKTLKSTARIATQVMTIIAERYVVMKGWIGRGSELPELCSLVEESFSDRRGGFDFCWGRDREELRRIRAAGEARRTLRSKGAEEYKVVAKRIANTLIRKSVTRAVVVYGLKKERRD